MVATTDHSSESQTTFFRQGTWLILATGLCGGFMMASQMVAMKWMDPQEWGVFFILLRVYLLFGIPSLGLQTVFAQQAAAAVTPERRQYLAATVRAVHRGTLAFWLVLVGVTWLGQSTWLEMLGVPRAGALWATVGMGLAALWVPVWKGVVQGRQQFAGLGWSLILDGAGRFVAIAAIIALGGQATGGMVGALLGQAASLAVVFWVGRDILALRGEGFRWRPWLGRVFPLMVGAGIFMLMTTFDAVYVRSVFPKEISNGLYNPAAMIGLALMVITTPLVQVMFPKVARSAALTKGSRAMMTALVMAGAVGALAALICTVAPTLPLRIISLNRAAYLGAAPLVPWFAWALLPLMLAMVLTNNLLAQERFAIVPGMTVVAVLYCGGLILGRSWLITLEPLAACRTVLIILGVANLVLLGLAIGYSLRERVPIAGEGPSV